MMAARAAADGGANVIIVDKSLIGRGGATILAQMTVAVALGDAEDDSPDIHFEDTMAGSRGMADPAIVRAIVDNGPQVIRDLDDYGVRWAKTPDGRFSQVVSPGHSRKRCVYVDILNTGGATSTALRKWIWKDEKITRLKNVMITRLIKQDGRVVGAAGFSMEELKPVSISASSTIMATGGLTEIFERNSASSNMTGDGYLLAAQAGCELNDMEMVQFFPIAHLYPPLVGIDPIMWDPFRYKLGGHLLNGNMEEFMDRYANEAAGEYTATRDLTSYAIFKEVEAGRGTPHGGAFLDFTMISEEELRKGFGPVIDILLKQGVDLTKDVVEVAPMAHFMLGGIKVNAAMETDVPGLLACGELISGMHGANRLSGNAITEALVTGRIAGQQAAKSTLDRNDEYVESESEAEWLRLSRFWHPREVEKDDRSILEIKRRIKKAMWEGAGPLRTEAELKNALVEIIQLRKEIEDTALAPAKYYALPLVEKIEAHNMTVIGESIILGAIERRESRGAHVRLDFPEQLEEVYNMSFRLNSENVWSVKKLNR